MDLMSPASFEALQAVEALLQNPSGEVFVSRLTRARLKKLGALFEENSPFRSDPPAGFRSWWECSEPKRRRWLEKVEGNRGLNGYGLFGLTNLPLKEIAPGTEATGSFFLMLASKGIDGQVRFSKAMSGFLVFGHLLHRFRHDASDIVGVDPKRAA